MSAIPCACGCGTAGEDYASGPTACIASPAVVASIRRAVRQARVLSTADARLAMASGMLGIPSVGRSGFNDGVIYPPTAPMVPRGARAARGQPPSRMFALGAAKGPTTLNCLVLLVDFPDNAGTETPAHYQSLLFDPANPNSMASFYKDLSYGQLNVTGQVTNWIRASKPYAFYVDGQSGTGTNFPHNTPGLLEEVLKKYCRNHSLAPFDANGDGFVDGLFLVHAGPGAEAEPDLALRKDKIWSHKWTLPAAFVDNGVSAFAYFTAPEDGRLGVFSHEFGHFLGLPDLYDTSYRSEGIGNWCLMASGSWAGQGNAPTRLSAWCLATLGWVKPTNLKASGPLRMAELAGNRTQCWRVWAGGAPSPEYFLIENRQQAGRDSGLPGSGLAVWHIDETQSDNTNPLAYRVQLVQADGRRDLEFARNQGDDGDLFPGSGGVGQVDDQGAAHPHTRRNDGTASGVAFANIQEAGGIVTVDVTL